MTRAPQKPVPAPQRAAAELGLSAEQSLQSAYVTLVRIFSAAGLDQPHADARYLLRGALALDDAVLLRSPEAPLGPGAERLAQAVARRLAHEPVSRILGSREFYGRAFEVTPDVLDPRADTETLIDEVLAIVDRRGWRNRPLSLVDVGLGSGAILVTLLAELPLAHGIGTDVSPAALACARRNAARHGVAPRMETVETSVLDNIEGPIDIVVSNPPYIPRQDIAGLDPDVRLFDPMVALDGGPDGLQIYRKIAGQISVLPHVSYVILEVGTGQAEDVARLFGNLGTETGVWSASFRRDLGGVQRCVTLERQSSILPAKTVGTTGKPI